MAIIIRFDVDRPYGREPLLRHCLSRLSSDLYFPRVSGFGYLSELNKLLTMLNEERARAYVFFRRCTLPSKSTLELLNEGRHEVGLHLENSRSYATFLKEKRLLETHFEIELRAFSKHGSGGAKYGFHHYAPYEPNRYMEWAERTSMRLFLGNLEDPRIEGAKSDNGLIIFPAAFWLEPSWRDTNTFPVDWLLEHARDRDIVLLVHPENVLSQPKLVEDFKKIIRTVESRIFE